MHVVRLPQTVVNSVGIPVRLPYSQPQTAKQLVYVIPKPDGNRLVRLITPAGDDVAPPLAKQILTLLRKHAEKLPKGLVTVTASPGNITMDTKGLPVVGGACSASQSPTSVANAPLPHVPPQQVQQSDNDLNFSEANLHCTSGGTDRHLFSTPSFDQSQTCVAGKGGDHDSSDIKEKSEEELNSIKQEHSQLTNEEQKQVTPVRVDGLLTGVDSTLLDSSVSPRLMICTSTVASQVMPTPDNSVVDSSKNSFTEDKLKTETKVPVCLPVGNAAASMPLHWSVDDSLSTTTTATNRQFLIIPVSQVSSSQVVVGGGDTSYYLLNSRAMPVVAQTVSSVADSSSMSRLPSDLVFTPAPCVSVQKLPQVIVDSATAGSSQPTLHSTTSVPTRDDSRHISTQVLYVYNMYFILHI
ncbi:unnamed protein product [Soboliphyme baturini]|uniref:SPOC domain-containing protein n=1 Tax=Soboliphyme baturini TaxID=241478 RepID=A0A183J904_9BILA|nr:unnamed protein product [Soboliphyme baturini]